MLLWLVVVYGGIAVSTLRRHLVLAAGPPPADRIWIVAAALLLSAGLLLGGLLALGPMLVSAAEQTWGLSTPISRRGWLLPRSGWMILGSAAGAALLAGIIALLGFGSGTLLAAGAGACWGAAAVGWGILGQGDRAVRRRVRWAGLVLLGGGAAAALAGVLQHYGGLVASRPDPRAGKLAAASAGVLAVWGVARALARLGKLDRVALSAGVEVAGAAATAAVWIDPALLAGTLDTRRWRRVGSVRSRPFFHRVSGRAAALFQADLRRAGRRPLPVVLWAALALAQYAVAVVAPAAASLTWVIGAYLSAGRLTWGLRTVANAGGLRRALGGSDRLLRLVHLGVPGAALLLWYLLTWPVAPHVGPADLLILGGILAAVYRAATRGPVSYDTGMLETPLGLLPIGLLLQLARGPDALGLVLIAELVLRR